MRCIRLTDPAALATGTFSGTRLDPQAGALAGQGTPALVADIDPASASVAAPNQVGTLGGTWGQVTSTLLVPIPPGGSAGPVSTSAVNAAWTYVTNAYAIDIAYLQSALGAIGHVTVDGQPARSFDSSSGQSSRYRLYLDGQSHTVAVTYRGDAVAGTALVGAPADTAGTAGLAAALSAARNGAAVNGDTWTVAATSASQVQVKNGAGAVQGTLGAGQVSDALIPGVTLALVAGGWDATSQAQIKTTAPTLTLTQVTTYAALAPSASYAGAVLDSGAANSAWPFVELLLGPLGSAVPGMLLGVGDTPAPDASWSWATLAAVAIPDPLGNPWQRVVYGGPAARGRYAQAVGALSNQVRAQVSDLRVYLWQPESDPALARLPRAVYRGPNAQALLAALAALEAFLDEEADELLAGGAIGTARGKYLSAWGQELLLPRLPGEPDAAYRSRLGAVFSGRGQGGSQPFLQQTLSGALGCAVQVSARARAGTAFALGQTALGDAGLGQSSVGYWRWTVQVPLAQLQVPVETAAQIVGQLRPTGSIVSIIYV